MQRKADKAWLARWAADPSTIPQEQVPGDLRVVVPDETVDEERVIELGGGVSVHLRAEPGPAHTKADLWGGCRAGRRRAGIPSSVSSPGSSRKRAEACVAVSRARRCRRTSANGSGVGTNLPEDGPRIGRRRSLAFALSVPGFLEDSVAAAERDVRGPFADP